MYDNAIQMTPKHQEIIKRVTDEMKSLQIEDQMELVSAIKRFLIDGIENKGLFHREQIKVYEEYMNMAKSI